MSNDPRELRSELRHWAEDDLVPEDAQYEMLNAATYLKLYEDDIYRLEQEINRVAHTLWLLSIRPSTIIQHAGAMQALAERLERITTTDTTPLGLKWGDERTEGWKRR